MLRMYVATTPAVAQREGLFGTGNKPCLGSKLNQTPWNLWPYVACITLDLALSITSYLC